MATVKLQGIYERRNAIPAAELKPGSTAGSYTLDMTIPRGDVGTVDTAQAYTWTQPHTYDAMINANGGIKALQP